MKKTLCAFALGMVGALVACKLMNGSCNCDDMVDDLMKKKNKTVKKMKKFLEN